MGDDPNLPAFGRPSYLRYRPKRYQCQDCEGHPTTTQDLDWHEANSPHSFTYDNHVILQLVHSTVEDVSIKEGLPYASVAGALERRIDKCVDWARITNLETLGLDEIALRKGRGNYVTLVTGRLCGGEIVLLGVLPGHEKAEVIEFLRSPSATHPTNGADRLLRFVESVYRRQHVKRFQQPALLPIASMLPGIIGMQRIKSENRNCNV